MMSPLERRTVVRSGDVDELTAVGTRLFSPHQLRYRGKSARLSATPLATAHLICMQYGGDAAVETTEALDYYAVHVPLFGRSAVTFGREAVRPAVGGGVVFNPGDQPTMGWSSDLCQLAIRVPEPTMRSQVAALTGRAVRGRLQFTHLAPPSAGWVAVLRTLADVAEQSPADRLPDALAQRLLESFVTVLLMSQPQVGANQMLTSCVKQAGPSAVESAVTLIRAKPDQPWSLSALAAATGVSGRSLEAGFRLHRDCTPMEFVRTTRMNRAHDLLLDPRHAADPIAEIATSAGFSHLGRFAAAYRDTYGVSPSVMRRSVLHR